MNRSNIGKSQWNCDFCSQVFQSEWPMIAHSTFEHGDANKIIDIICPNNDTIPSFDLTYDKDYDIENIKTFLMKAETIQN